MWMSESAYKAAGKGRCAHAMFKNALFAVHRLGPTSPVWVRQGQISELINAKPKRPASHFLERRPPENLGGFMPARHEAGGLRLNGTETNLARSR